jgi:xanthine dehydrogenase molybdopterin-binding subunit B
MCPAERRRRGQARRNPAGGQGGFFHGQIVALVVGESQEACRAAAEKVVVEYEPLPPILTLRQAIAKAQFSQRTEFHPARQMCRRIESDSPHDARRRI